MLTVSQKIVDNVHGKKNKVTGVIKSDRQGEHRKCNGVSENPKTELFVHINFPYVLYSHYCRAKTNKIYVETG